MPAHKWFCRTATVTESASFLAAPKVLIKISASRADKRYVAVTWRSRMSTSPVSFGSVPAQPQGPTAAQQITQDFKQLASSLQSGDLSGAQQAYSAIQKLLPNQSQNSQQATSD